MRLPALIAVAVLMTSACGTVPSVTTPIVSVAKNCGDKALHDAALKVLDDVSSALICESGNVANLPACVEAGLAAVAKSVGWDAVWCAVDWAEGAAATNAQASADGLEALKRIRASAWKAKYGPGPVSAPTPAQGAISPPGTSFALLPRRQ